MSNKAKIKVAITGISGRMGVATSRLLAKHDSFELVGALGKPGAAYLGKDLNAVTNCGITDILVSNELNKMAQAVKPDVLLEFTIAEVAFENAKQAMEMGIRPVIGTSGLGDEKISKLTEISKKTGVGALVIPNFSLGAVLMMEFAKQAGAYFSNVEIVEMHHTEKHDAPSGTAMYTAKKLAQANSNYNPKKVDEKELLKGSRGGVHESGVRVHSLRLPGLISHQEVIFGSPGELLTVRHDSFNTDCFLKGVEMALKAVMNINELVVGLENVLAMNEKTKQVQMARH